jgi:hypothetical protein
LLIGNLPTANMADDMPLLNPHDRQQTLVIACGEQPQQRFESFGAGALSDT